MHSWPLSHKYEQFFVKITFPKSMILKVNNTFEPNVLKLAMKLIFVSSSPFAFLIINFWIHFKKNLKWCIFGRKKKCLKKIRIFHSQGLNTLNMQKYFWFVLGFEHTNFATIEKYSQNYYDNLSYYVSLVIFQIYKKVVLRNVQSLCDSFACIFIPK
jgi:hypothetical protein